MDLTEADPKGLVRESYAIDGISTAECKSIFLDWALSVPAGTDPVQAVRRLIAEYGAAADHPMTAVLTEALDAAPAPTRRGGRRTRVEGG